MSRGVRLQDILHLYQEQSGLADFAEILKNDDGGVFRIEGLVGSQSPFMVAALYRNIKKSVLVVLNDREEALYFMNDLQSIMPQKEIVFFPASYKRPYQIEQIDNANVLQRAELLNRLNHTHTGRQMIITFAEALCEKVVNKRALVKNTLELKVGEDCGMEFVTEVLEEYGFELCDFVYEPGQYAVRGGILDVYSFSFELPYRFEFFGSEVESIRAFDPVTQISKEEIKHVSLIPNIQELLLREDKNDFLEYISKKTITFIQNPDFVAADLDKHFERATQYFAKLQSDSGGAATSFDPESLYTSGKLFLEQLSEFTSVEFGSRAFSSDYAATLSWQGSGQPQFKKEFELLADHLKKNSAQGITNYILSENEKQIQRLSEIFDEIDRDVHFTGIDGSLHRGFSDKLLNITCYTDHEIFERYHRYKSRSQVSRSQALTLKELNDLQPADYVTHIHHGIGKFAGLHRIKVGVNFQEAIKIIYKDGDEVFVNVNSLYKISKYSGKDGSEPKLNKIGSKEWAKAKAKTRSRIKKLAFDLIELYAKRKAQKGFSFAPDGYLQQELEASFMYVDTPDQLKTTDDVKGDMESPTPMDRLVCGDVGFGKTEIAIRAAFKAAVNGKQTAILVPTTILAVQHYYTFKERLKNFPIRVDYINRFKSSKQQKETWKAVSEGKVDILIGTHSIVNKAEKYKDLGLLVIDEEQKFGVNVKDKIKTLKVNIDTMTLTATPIPRTMQFSLMGVRDLSIIATPPTNRQPVETRVCSFDATILRDAISYELKRGGQVFFVHNRIKEMEEMASIIKKLVPDARIALIHGQLPGEQVEKIMLSFIESGYDVLLSTTIVESGLDIPNANTIIINQAQSYGLSDLHQMRGRVGRSNRKGFCYLLAPPESVLSRDAKKRLKAIEEFSDLGSGFHIAMRDLDIRGSGDLLGGEQSGYINEIGHEMYNKILDDAVLELKEQYYPELFKEEIKAKKDIYVDDTQVDTDLNIMIPNEYIPSISERLAMYKRIASTPNEHELRKLSKEFIDRFGPIPAPVLGLFDTVRVRNLGKMLGLEKVVLKNNALRLYFVSDPQSRFYQSKVFTRLLDYVHTHSHKVRFKESKKYLSLEIKPIVNLKETFYNLQEILNFSKNEDRVTQQS